MPTYRDEGVVLRTHNLGEADRIITVLSRRHGKVRAVARGVRRTSSKWGARLEPFSHVDLQFATGRTLDVITEAVTLHAWSEPLCTDYNRYTVGHVLLETADRLVSVENEPALHQYRLLAGALHALVTGTSDGPRPSTLVMDSYLLRAVATAGFAPSLDGCASCGTPGPHEAFSPAAGGLVCPRCRPPGTAQVRPGTLALLSALLSGDWPATRDADAPTMRQASGLVAAFVAWHLERGLRTIEHVSR
ncbi:MAG: DNA repair protein RecO [Propionibacteriaceae bacterium]|nr:DNA repair protein RecO [Propionibacteriaceae bacterium]